MFSDIFVILIEGARRVGKSTIVEEFAHAEYQSCLIIDFNKARKEVIGYFIILGSQKDANTMLLPLYMTFCINNAIGFEGIGAYCAK